MQQLVGVVAGDIERQGQFVAGKFLAFGELEGGAVARVEPVECGGHEPGQVLLV